MKVSHITPAFLIALAMGLAGWSVAQTLPDANGFVKVKPGDIKWAGASSTSGLQSAVLVGDPSKPGPYVIRVKFSPGAMTRPHSHSQDRFVTVISGTWYTGTSDKFEPEKTDPMPAGSFMKHPAHAVHYDGAKTEEAIVQIIGIGPVTTEYVNSADAPARRTP